MCVLVYKCKCMCVWTSSDEGFEPKLGFLFYFIFIFIPCRERDNLWEYLTNRKRNVQFTHAQLYSLSFFSPSWGRNTSFSKGLRALARRSWRSSVADWQRECVWEREKGRERIGKRRGKIRRKENTYHSFHFPIPFSLYLPSSTGRRRSACALWHLPHGWWSCRCWIRPQPQTWLLRRHLVSCILCETLERERGREDRRHGEDDSLFLIMKKFINQSKSKIFFCAFGIFFFYFLLFFLAASSTNSFLHSCCPSPTSHTLLLQKSPNPTWSSRVCRGGGAALAFVRPTESAIACCRG